MSEQETKPKAKKYKFRLMVGSYHEASWVTRKAADGTEVRDDLGTSYRAITDPSIKLTFEERFPLVETDINLAEKYNRPNSQKFAPASHFLGQNLNTEEGIQQEIDRLVEMKRRVGEGAQEAQVSDGLDTMSVTELREYAQADGIAIPKDARSKEQLVATIRGARTAVTTG
jgi:hypothetical protein